MAKKKCKHGNVLLKARKDDKGNAPGGCSVGGVEYTNDKEGIIEVPAEDAEALKPHGYDPIEADPEPAEDAKPEAPAA